MRALEWPKTTFECVAQAHVAGVIHQMLVGKDDAGKYIYPHFEHVRDRVKEEALRRARAPELSTSPTSNLLSLFVAAAWAEYASQLDGRL